MLIGRASPRLVGTSCHREAVAVPEDPWRVGKIARPTHADVARLARLSHDGQLRSFTFEIKSPPAAVLLKQAAGIPLKKERRRADPRRGKDQDVGQVQRIHGDFRTSRRYREEKDQGLECPRCRSCGPDRCRNCSQHGVLPSKADWTSAAEIRRSS